MIAGLTHPPLIGRYHEKSAIEAPRARNHISNKSLMAGHIDYADFLCVFTCKMGKSQIYRQPALLFFRQHVGVNSGQCFNQPRLSMVYMAGCSDYIQRFYSFANTALKASDTVLTSDS